ncbi:MAG: sensor histidine kinase, partial [Hyphomicrobiaceae bacterium]
LWLAERFVAPIRRLIAGAQEVSKGNLQVELPIRRGEGDLRRLSQTFNTMTADLRSQRGALVTANEQLTERRRFTEAVLANVSAGVLGLDGDGRITIANRSAEKLLGSPAGGLTGKPLQEVVPEFDALPDADTAHGDGRAHAQVTRVVAGEIRTFAVTVTRERSDDREGSAVVTFDDITELVAAQRSSAWADVARRIAHEIKNPLTPIQLSAERIRRKYTNAIKPEDREVLEKCTATIIRQVGDVTRMVDEFSAFARMPKPQMETLDVREVVREALTLFQMSTSDIAFEMTAPDEAILVLLDRRLISQAIANLVKNAAEAIQQAAEKAGKGSNYKGHVDVRIARVGDRVLIDVIDNGIGLVRQNRSRLLEPYVTTKTKGTGLGLAIVQKIVEQHRGTIALEDAPPTPERSQGALVRIALAVRTGQTEAAVLETAAE